MMTEFALEGSELFTKADLCSYLRFFLDGHSFLHSLDGLWGKLNMLDLALPMVQPSYRGLGL
jgi:hypothetical protein